MFFKKKIQADTYFYSDPGGREENEDSVSIVTGKYGLMAVVADGLGGHGGGRIASRSAVDTMEYCFKKDGSMDGDAYSDWFSMANQGVLDHQTGDCEMKTTMVLLRIQDRCASWAHLGDSRLYHFYNGTLCEQTVDHSVSQMAVFRGEITQDQIRGHEDRNRVLKALGRDDQVRPEVKEPMALSPGRHAFLLCTDGFWEYVYEKEMEEDLRLCRNAAEWVEELRMLLRSRAKPGNDNNTAAAVIMDVN